MAKNVNLETLCRRRSCDNEHWEVEEAVQEALWHLTQALTFRYRVGHCMRPEFIYLAAER
jgi:hypothetical protein